MATIIAGLFETLAEAEKAKTALKNEAFAMSDVSVFALNPPGQHALYPIGGDEDTDPGAKEAHVGAASGAIVGGAAALGVGAAAMAATGAGPAVAAAAAGAYTGSLVGALNSLGDSANDAQQAPIAGRHAGVMVAVNARSTKTPGPGECPFARSRRAIHRESRRTMAKWGMGRFRSAHAAFAGRNRSARQGTEITSITKSHCGTPFASRLSAGPRNIEKTT